MIIKKTVFNHVFLIYYILLGGLEENWIMTFRDFFWSTKWTWGEWLVDSTSWSWTSMSNGAMACNVGMSQNLGTLVNPK